MSYRVVGCDPGEANFGYTCLEASLKRGRLLPFVHEIGMFNRTINNLTDKPQKLPKSKRRKKNAGEMIPPLQDRLPVFEKFWEDVLDEFEPDAMVTERYQNRGTKGRSAETVSIMNGLLAGMCLRRDIKFLMITAATWKNRVNDNIVLEDVYSEVSLTPHSVDSSFIAVYGAVQHYQIDWNEVNFDHHIDELCAFES